MPVCILGGCRLGYPARDTMPVPSQVGNLNVWDCHIALIECKVGMTADEASAQIWARGYAEMYRQEDKPITVWGCNSSPTNVPSIPVRHGPWDDTIRKHAAGSTSPARP